MKKKLALFLCFVSLLTGREALVQAATDTPTATLTPSITPTPNNSERALMETIVPPASCGNIYNPCSGMPWSVPLFPTVALPSPTLIMVMADTGTTPVPGGTPTPSPVPSPTDALIDTSGVATVAVGLQDASGTLAALSAATIQANGTEESVSSLGVQLSGEMPNVFSTVRGVLAATNNKAMGIVMFLFLAVLFVIAIFLLTMAFPLIVRVVEFVLQVITAVKPF